MTAAGGGVRRKRSEKGETGTMAAGEDYAVEETASNGKAEGYKEGLRTSWELSSELDLNEFSFKARFILNWATLMNNGLG